MSNGLFVNNHTQTNRLVRNYIFYIFDMKWRFAAIFLSPTKIICFWPMEMYRKLPIFAYELTFGVGGGECSTVFIIINHSRFSIRNWFCPPKSPEHAAHFSISMETMWRYSIRWLTNWQPNMRIWFTAAKIILFTEREQWTQCDSQRYTFQSMPYRMIDCD